MHQYAGYAELFDGRKRIREALQAVYPAALQREARPAKVALARFAVERGAAFEALNERFALGAVGRLVGAARQRPRVHLVVAVAW